MIKTIYLAKRHPDTTYAQFVENWKQHAVLSGTFPEIVGRFESVVQCARADLDVDPALGLRQDFDGANLLGLNTLFDAVDVYRQEGIDTLRTDERRVFSDYVSASSMTAHEEVVFEGERTGAVLLELVRREPGTDLRHFLEAWSGDGVERLRATAAYGRRVRRHVHNLVVLPTPPGWDFDGVAELWFDDTDAAVSYLEETRTEHAHPPGPDRGFATLLERTHTWVRRHRPAQTASA